MIPKSNPFELKTDVNKWLKTLLQELNRHINEYLIALIRCNRTFSQYVRYWIRKNILYINVEIKRKRTGKRPRDYKTVSINETEDGVP